MNNYEAVLIFKTELADADRNNLLDRFKGHIEENGEVVSVDDWGKRRLAYPINDFEDGYYVLANFSSKPDFPAELDRVFKITEGVLRSMTLAVEE